MWYASGSEQDRGPARVDAPNYATSCRENPASVRAGDRRGGGSAGQGTPPPTQYAFPRFVGTAGFCRDIAYSAGRTDGATPTWPSSRRAFLAASVCLDPPPPAWSPMSSMLVTAEATTSATYLHASALQPWLETADGKSAGLDRRTIDHSGKGNLSTCGGS
jgi:hypothetical protein